MATRTNSRPVKVPTAEDMYRLGDLKNDLTADSRAFNETYRSPPAFPIVKKIAILIESSSDHLLDLTCELTSLA